MATLVLAVTSGCSSSQAQGVETPVAEVATAADCLAPQVLTALGVPQEVVATRSPHADAPVAGQVPGGFVPVSVLSCELDGTLRDSDGVWSAITATRLEGDLDALVSALALPSASRTGTCTGPQPLVPVLWLVDAMGRAVRPLWPTDRCGRPQPGVSEALEVLEATGSDTYRAALERAASPTG
ncbi:hypothetical protein [Cellulomonas soli]|uniref:Uncharacterized protein n=1 Tax=Cellulomonas soli TaxID=931535 RepID=A0A512P911_9CELL|nr:hypothetical protein [Cellulomonas soli]NYI57904.1 hypothetical protein [Cellulomonas soli]GEP67688.1 hypothetical protein CSO01_04030 [Cellulomonas soli]